LVFIRTFPFIHRHLICLRDFWIAQIWHNFLLTVKGLSISISLCCQYFITSAGLADVVFNIFECYFWQLVLLGMSKWTLVIKSTWSRNTQYLLITKYPVYFNIWHLCIYYHFTFWGLSHMYKKKYISRLYI